MNGPDDTPVRRDGLESRIGHRFSDAELLDLSLAHASSRQDRLKTNERLEFLGDRVLGLSIARLLYERYPDEAEGELGYRFTALVKKEALAEVARTIDLAAHMTLSGGEAAGGGRANPSILADCCEALIGAIYLDAGHDAAYQFVATHWQAQLERQKRPEKDAKTVLQEVCQSLGKTLPKYSVIDRQGPDHAPAFTVCVAVTGWPDARGRGGAKQAAEQAAAQAMLDARDAAPDGAR